MAMNAVKAAKKPTIVFKGFKKIAPLILHSIEVQIMNLITKTMTMRPKHKIKNFGIFIISTFS